MPTTLPSTRKSTWSTAMLSDAVALRFVDPETVAPASGAVRLTVGAVGSIWIWIAWLLSRLPTLS